MTTLTPSQISLLEIEHGIHADLSIDTYRGNIIIADLEDGVTDHLTDLPEARKGIEGNHGDIFASIGITDVNHKYEVEADISCDEVLVTFLTEAINEEVAIRTSVTITVEADLLEIDVNDDKSVVLANSFLESAVDILLK